MKHISELIKKERKMPSVTNGSRVMGEAKEIVDMLFMAFEEHVKFFRANHPSGYDYAKREWTKTFAECGVSKERIQIGIKKMRKSGDFYASITPAEFLSLCKVSYCEIGAPATQSAYLEACKNSHPCETEKKWSHKVVRYAAHKTGSHFLRTESKSVTFPVFEKEYLNACQMHYDGKILDQIGTDSPQLRRELEETKKIIADGFEGFNSPRKALSLLRDLLK